MLFEIPSLKGVDVAQAVAGTRSSYVRTKKEGRVLGFGANEFGLVDAMHNSLLLTLNIIRRKQTNGAR